MDALEQFLYDTGIAMPGEVKSMAHRIRRSEWLAAVVAAAKVEALEEAADIWHPDTDGPPPRPYIWLRARAATLRTTIPGTTETTKQGDGDHE